MSRIGALPMAIQVCQARQARQGGPGAPLVAPLSLTFMPCLVHGMNKTKIMLNGFWEPSDAHIFNPQFHSPLNLRKKGEKSLQ